MPDVPTAAPLGAMRPEIEMLLCCGRSDMDGPRAERVRTLLSGQLDWTLLIQLGLRHGMLSLLYTHLRAIDPDKVPGSVRDQLRDRYYTIARWNLCLTAELIAILQALEAHAIPAIPFKGAALANTIYGNPAQREFADLDILVRPKDVPGATDLLISQHFIPWIQLSGAQQEVHRRAQYAYTFSRERDGVDVDLHWGFGVRHLSFEIDAERVWERTELVSINGSSVRTFKPETLLLLLCVHGAKHGPFAWPKLKWICDVAELVRARPKLDWQLVREEARARGCYRVLLLGLSLANDLLGAPLPSEVMKDLQADRVVGSLALQIRERLFRDSGDQPTPFAKACFEFRVRERLREKVRYSLRRLVTPTKRDWELIWLPGFLSVLYLPLRFARLAGQYGPRPWHLKHFWKSEREG